jgi:hypothetical protein
MFSSGPDRRGAPAERRPVSPLPRGSPRRGVSSTRRSVVGVVLRARSQTIESARRSELPLTREPPDRGIGPGALDSSPSPLNRAGAEDLSRAKWAPGLIPRVRSSEAGDFERGASIGEDARQRSCRGEVRRKRAPSRSSNRRQPIDRWRSCRGHPSRFTEGASEVTLREERAVLSRPERANATALEGYDDDSMTPPAHGRVGGLPRW